MRFLSNFGCEIIFMCSVNFWHRQDSNSLFKGGIGHVTSQCKWPINFKILLVTYKILHGFAPTYLNELFNHTPHRLLLSSSFNLLSIPKTTKATYGDKSFSIIATKLWNDLPITIKQCSRFDSFKLRLQTFLFNRVCCQIR